MSNTPLLFALRKQFYLRGATSYDGATRKNQLQVGTNYNKNQLQVGTNYK